MLIPAVAEPQLIWQISGRVLCEDRELGGSWNAHSVEPNDLFLVTSPEPYELRWRAMAPEPMVVMHATLGLHCLASAAREWSGEGSRIPRLKEFNGIQDPTILAFLEMLRKELTLQPRASGAFVHGIAQSLAAHLVRTYRDENDPRPHRSTALPAYPLHRVLSMMEGALQEGVSIGALATAVDLSESHFSRMFKGSTGFSPSRYFIRLRISKAQELLRETKMPIIEIGLEVGYTSPSHFAHVFRKETGWSPHEYRERMHSGRGMEDFSRIAIE